MIADTLYNMLAQKFGGFEDCDASKSYIAVTVKLARKSVIRVRLPW